MNRRRCLAVVGAALSGGFAGCLGNDNGANGSPAEGDGDGSENGSIEGVFEQALIERDIDVHFLGTTEDRITLDYITTTTTEGELIEEMNTTTDAYASVLETDWEIGFAEVWVLDPDAGSSEEESIISYVIENEWVFEWREDASSDEELMDRVLDSVEAYQGFQNRYGD